MINILKNIGIVGVMMAALSVLGLAINQLVPWSWLTNFFVIIRYFSILFDWIWDVPTMYVLLTIAFSLQITVWGFKASIAAVNYFKNN